MLRNFSSKKHFIQKLDMRSINPRVIQAEYAVRGAIEKEAAMIRVQLASGKQYPFKDLISCNIGNPFAVGKPPLTFARQMIAATECKDVLELDSIPQEVKQRAKEFLAGFPGGLGAYSHSQGYESVRKNVARFITKRDGVPCDAKRIFLTTGASQCVSTIFEMLISTPNVGILTPFPTYPLYTAETVMKNGQVVPYYLKESAGWSLDFEDIQDSIKNARDQGIDVRAIVVINPGNPTGSVLSYEQIRKCIEFCEANNLLLIADEVYQQCIFNDQKPFISFKKVASEMNSHIQLISLHSISKGFMGECGQRGGYMELHNIPDDVQEQILKMASISLCPPTVGQLLVDIMVRPPTGECKQLWEEETTMEIEKMKHKAQRLAQTLMNLPGMSCQPADGAMYLFPSLNLPLKTFEAAKSCRIDGESIQPDMFWALNLLRETGIMVVPGSGFGQITGTQHFRITFLPFAEKMDAVIERITEFQKKFMEQYS